MGHTKGEGSSRVHRPASYRLKETIQHQGLRENRKRIPWGPDQGPNTWGCHGVLLLGAPVLETRSRLRKKYTVPQRTAESLTDWLEQFPLFPLLRKYVRSYWTRHLDSVPRRPKKHWGNYSSQGTDWEHFGTKSAPFTDLPEQELKAYHWNAERD